MKNAIVIAAREFEEKRFVVYAALYVAVMPFVLALISSGNSAKDTIAMGSLIFATGFAIALAVMTGASFVGRDLSDGRMSFYFSRPIASSSIWFGKLTAGMLMVVGCFAVIITPAWLVAGKIWNRWSISPAAGITVVLTVALSLFLIAHVIGTFARSRSPLIAVDIAAAVVCGVAIRYLVPPLVAGQAVTLIEWLARYIAIALVVAIVAGGAWQLERGRTDRRRSHLALSQFLWSTMAIALLIAAGYVGWVVSVKPGDLTGEIHATHSAGGPFATISGKARGRVDYHAGFLLDTEDGSVARIDSRAEWSVRYTRDGRSAFVPSLEGAVANVLVYRRGSTKPVDTGLTMDAGEYFVSDDGGRIATIARPGIVSIYDVAQKRSLVSVRLPESKFERGLFVTPDVLRFYLRTAEGLKIVEIDVRTRGLRETGFLASPQYAYFYADPSAAHMLVRRSREDVLVLSDARTGEPIRTLASGTRVKAARFLRDGRIAIVDGPDSATVLHVLTAEGVPQRDIPLGPSTWTTIVGDDGTRVVLTSQISAEHSTLMAIDVNRSVVERREAIRDLIPLNLELDLRPPIGPLRDVFYRDDRGRIVSWNPANGAKRMITGG